MTTHKWKLVRTESRLELQCEDDERLKPVYVDFLHGPLGYRKAHRGKELLLRAVGKVGSVIDATAGLGHDALMLISQGYQVTLLERSPIIAELLMDGLQRAGISVPLIVSDAIEYLKLLTDYPDVIYMDPMFPERSKTALVKKEMRMLRDVVGEDLDAEDLLSVALERAKKRVVVKRPRLAKLIPGPKPSYQWVGRSSRFDVYGAI